MKKQILLAAWLMIIAVAALKAQAIHTISNPYTTPYDEASNGSPYYNYAGNPVAYNNHLYFYYDTANGDFSQSTLFLAEYTATGDIKFFTNPDKGGFLFADPNQHPQAAVDEFKDVVFNDKLFMPYNNASHATDMAVFDGTNVTLAANPDNSPYGYQGFATAYNNTLYLYYVNSFGTGYLAKYNETINSIELIANPDNSPYGVQGDFFIFNNKLYAKYSVAGNGSWHLASYDGSSWQIIANPDNSSQGYQGSETEIVWNNNLYACYYTNNQNRLMKFDGTAITLIPLPAGDAGITNAGFTNFPVVYNNALYFSYANHNNSGANNLAKYDGSAITVIPNPDNTPYGFWNTPVIYDNQLCFYYANASGVHQLAKYDGASVTLIPNPDSSPYGYWNFPIVYDNKLFFQYRTNDVSIGGGVSAPVYQLGYYDNNAMKLIANTGYNGFPIVSNDTLFMQYAQATTANLCYLDTAALPVTLTGFSAVAKNNTVLLQWHTATEINNNYFDIERSATPSGNGGFISIGTVAGNGTSSQPHDYSFTDNEPDLNQVNYYRLKQVDNDGKFTYSGIVSASFGSSQSISVYPNPAHDYINIKVINAGSISIYDVQGSLIKKLQIQAGNNIVDVHTFAPGIYFGATDDGKFKFVKE